jgi:hypothetical protein
MIESVPGTYRAKARIVLVSPCNEALKQGRITSHLLRGLIVQVPTRRAKVILATNEQLEVMAAKLGDRGLMGSGWVRWPGRGWANPSASTSPTS